MQAVAQNNVVQMLPAMGQAAVRLQIGTTTINVAAHFWNEGFKQRTCLRCANALDKCGCTEASDLLELPKSACKVDKKDGALRGAIKIGARNGGTHRAIGVEVRIPRDRKNGNNAWLRKLCTLPASSRLPKVMHLQVHVVADGGAADSPSVTFEGYSRLVAKNGGVKEKALLSVHPDSKAAASHTLIKSRLNATGGGVGSRGRGSRGRGSRGRGRGSRGRGRGRGRGSGRGRGRKLSKVMA